MRWYNADNMELRRLLHAGLLITDLERSKQFYSGILGLKEKPRPDFDFPGAWYDLGDCELHLIGTEEMPAPGAARPARDFHVCFLIEDYEATKQALEKAGIRYREGSSGLAQIFVRDPDGNLIELQHRS